MIVVHMANTPEEADAFVARLADNGVVAMTRADFKASADLPSSFELSDRCAVVVSSEHQAELVRRVVGGETAPMPAPRPHSDHPLSRATLEIALVGVVLAGALACGGWGALASAGMSLAQAIRNPLVLGVVALCVVAIALRLRRGRSGATGEDRE